MTTLMEVRDLEVRFYTEEGTVYAVNGVGYDLKEGETLGVVGESGSGKSVHALSIMGLIPNPPGKVTSGSVVFRGRDLLKLPRHQMRLIRGAEIAMIFQDPMTSLNPVLTIGRQITEALELHIGMDRRQARARAVELLDMVGIPDVNRRLDDYPHQFSGGQRQRIMIAMALSCNPQLLIADEPTTALDVTVQAEIVDLVKRLSQELGMAMIWITHDLGVAAGLSDTIQVMYAGTVVERGPAEVIFKDPRHAYTLGLLNSLPAVNEKRGTKRLEPIAGSPPDMREFPDRDPFAPRNPYATERCWKERPMLRQAPDSHPEHLVAAWYDLREVTQKENV